MALRVFGLTGGIGSGKSTVAGRFAERGLPVVNADQLARRVVEPGSPALAEVITAFGPSVVNAEGTLDRKAVAAAAFADPGLRQRLEAITHPRIRALARESFAALDAHGEPLACYEAPLFYEAGLDAEIRPVVVVVAPEALLVERARRRDGSSEAQVRARLGAQLDPAEKARRADYVIDNGGSIEAAEQQADAVLAAICRAQGVDPSRYGLA